MEANPNLSSSSSSSLLRTLIAKGWCFRDIQRIEGIITDQFSSNGNLKSIESELLNMDLRSTGGKCLPDYSSLCKASHLRGPVILQVCSSRDISRSCIAETSGNSANRRLLRLKLTDGHSEINAVEYFPVPSIPDDVIPGTKVLLQDKASVSSGIVCLNPKVITILGGVVQSLYEEWQMKRKYLVDSNKTSHENVSDSPPPFEKLKIQAHARGISRNLGSSSNAPGHSLSGKSESSNLKETQNSGSATDDKKPLHHNDEDKEKKSIPVARPKVAASVPVQNQMAAQKLLQKTIQPDHNGRNFRHQRHRERVNEEETHSLTLDEWEKRKTGVHLASTSEHSGISNDEILARQLQNQFDLEDNHEPESSHSKEAKNITMSMFNFERDDSSRTEFRGRGRGRGRGRRGRGG